MEAKRGEEPNVDEGVGTPNPPQQQLDVLFVRAEIEGMLKGVEEVSDSGTAARMSKQNKEERLEEPIPVFFPGRPWLALVPENTTNHFLSRTGSDTSPSSNICSPLPFDRKPTFLLLIKE